MRVCRVCGGDEAEGAIFYKPSVGCNTMCRDCRRAQMVDRYRVQREFVSALKLERGCADCGYRDHVEALEFDHLPGFVKEFEIGTAIAQRRDIEELRIEIAKCEVVCANCHRVRTARRRQAA